MEKVPNVDQKTRKRWSSQRDLRSAHFVLDCYLEVPCSPDAQACIRTGLALSTGCVKVRPPATFSNSDSGKGWLESSVFASGACSSSLISSLIVSSRKDLRTYLSRARLAKPNCGICTSIY